jgi:hypothetical protein
VLFRGGLRDADVLLAEFDAVGDGVEDILISVVSCFVSDMLSFEVVDMILFTPNSLLYSSNSGVSFIVVRQIVFYVDRRVNKGVWCPPTRVRYVETRRRMSR